MAIIKKQIKKGVIAMKKAVSIILCACLLVTVFCSCNKNVNNDENGNTREKTVAISVWTTAQRLEETKKAVEKFKENDTRNTWNITVSVKEDVKSALMSDASSLPDLFCFSSADFDAFYKSGILEEITNEDSKIRMRNSDESIKAASQNEKLYAYPMSVNTQLLYYDKGKFNEEEVKSLEAIMFKDLGENKTNCAIDLTDSKNLTSFFVTSGCKLYGEDSNDSKSCNFNEENGVKAAEYMIDLASNEKFKSSGVQEIKDMFMSSSLGCAICGSTEYKQIKEILQSNFAVTTLPTVSVDDEDKKLVSTCTFEMYGVNANSAVSQEAMQLADYLTDDECQTNMASLNYAPTHKTLFNDNDVLKSSDVVSAVIAQTEKISLEPTIEQMTIYRSNAEEFGKSIVDRSTTKSNVKEKLDEFVKKITS